MFNWFFMNWTDVSFWFYFFRQMLEFCEPGLPIIFSIELIPHCIIEQQQRIMQFWDLCARKGINRYACVVYDYKNLTRDSK